MSQQVLTWILAETLSNEAVLDFQLGFGFFAVGRFRPVESLLSDDSECDGNECLSYELPLQATPAAAHLKCLFW